MAVDGDGHAWFGTEEGVSKLTPDGQWETYTTANSDMLSNWVYVVAPDAQGNVWIGTYEGLNVLTADGAWETYTQGNSGLLAEYVCDIAFDADGNGWLLTPGYEGGISVRMSDGSWIGYTPDNSGLSSKYGLTAIVVDEVGRVWIGQNGYGVDVLLPDWETWLNFDRSEDGVLSSNSVNDVAVGTGGDVWLATEPYSAYEPEGGVTRAYVGDPWPAWEIYNEENSDLSSNWLESVAVDEVGNVWFGHNNEYQSGWSCRPVGLASPLLQTEADTIDVLSADGTTWSTYQMPLYPWAVNNIVVDALGRKWFATDDGVARLSADNTTWDTFTTANSGLVSNYVNSVIVDGDGNAWFGTEEGVSKLTPDGQWETYITANSDLSSDWVHVIAADARGNVWIGTGYGLNVVTAGGQWETYTPATSDLPGDDIRDIAFDGEGNVWLAMEYDGVSVLLSDGSWQVYEPFGGGPAGDPATTIIVDGMDRVWVGYPGDGLDVLLPDGATWQHYAKASGNGLGSDIVNDIAVAPNGGVWLATEASESYYELSDGGATRVYDAGSGQQVLWTQQVSLDLGSPDVFSDTWVVEASALGVTGKLYLKGTLASPTGQEVVYDEQQFYIFAGDIAMTLDADPTISRPGETIDLSGRVENTGIVTLTGRTLVVSQDGETIHTIGPFDLAPGERVDFDTSGVAPADVDTTYFTARLADVEVVEAVRVGEPDVSIDVQAPSLAGSEPFSLTITMGNAGPLAGIVDVEIDSSDTQHETRYTQHVIPPGGVLILTEHYTIFADTVLTITTSGDLEETVVAPVTFGEASTVAFAPVSLYPEGVVQIPYTLTNTGHLPVEFTAAVTVTDSATETAKSQFEAYLPAGETGAGTLLFNLAVGDYTLIYETPFGGGEETFGVAPSVAADLSATVGSVSGSTITVNAILTNTGFYPIDGVLRLESPFFTTEQSVLLSPGLPTTSLPISLDISTASAGTYTATVMLLNGSDVALASTAVPIAVSGPDLVLVSTPDGLPVQAGGWVTLTFGLENQGAIPATAVLTVTVGNLLDEAQSVWLPGGASETLDFAFEAPDGLSGEALVGEAWFEGQRYDLNLPVDGVDLDVRASLDQPSYVYGGAATLHITVTNRSALTTPDLFALVSYHGEVITQPLTLAAGESGSLDFSLTAEARNDEIVFYGIYELVEERAIHLNTTYLRVRNPDVTIVLDRQVYEPGDTVHATVHASVTGTLLISAPGFSSTVQLPISDFQFILPDDLTRGTHAIDYTLQGGWPHSTPFDVDAPWVRVTEAHLLGLPYAPGDTVQADLTIASTHALDVSVRAWLLYPDRTGITQQVTRTVSLEAIHNNRVDLTLPLATSQAGPHSLFYEVIDAANPGRVLLGGMETFDVGSVVLLGLHTDREAYSAPTDPVTATLTLYTAAAGDANLTLLLDGAVVVERTLTLTEGASALVIPVPEPIPVGLHDLTARVEADGLSHAATVRIAYGTGAADMVVASPRLGFTSGPTRTVRAWVGNLGRTTSVTTTLELWDGAPSEGGVLIDTQPVEMLTPGTGIWVEVTWNVLGQAGPHTLFAVVNPEGTVAEFYEDNNRATSDVVVPPFDISVQTGATSYVAGAPVPITIQATNLTAVPATLVVTTTAESASYQVVFTDVRTLNLPAAAGMAETLTWNTFGLVEGSYAIHVQGINQEEAQEQAWASIWLHIPPQVEAGPDQSVSEGDVVAFTGTVTGLSSPSSHTILWRFGDGEIATGVLTPTHVYADDGVYVATLTLTDTTGLTVSDALTVTVTNTPPDVDLGEDLIVDEGTEALFSGNFTDPGTLDTHTIAWDFGDGNTTEGALTPTHIYGDDGVYTTTLMVADDDGGVGSDTVVVTVTNVAPVADAGLNRSVNEGQVVAFSGVFTDPGTLDTHVISWDLGDGDTVTGTLTPEHAYDDDGVYAVTLTVADDDGGVGSDAISVTVENVPPDVDAGPDQVITKGEAVQFSGVFTDVGPLDTHTILWDLGDGGTITGTLTPEHTYAEDGVYTATLTVTDDDGGVGSDAVRIVVLPKAEFEEFEIERADIHWWGRRGDQALFIIHGQLTLPDGYTPNDLTGDLQLALVIQGKGISDTVSLEKRGNTWVFRDHGSFPDPDDGMVTRAFLWHKPGSSQIRFTLYGVFAIDGVDRHTRPAEATVSLSLGVDEDDSLEGEQEIMFRTLRRLWWYRKLRWPWCGR
ncbi:MAG: PKD domain-containing protein [Anaerolineae bacterium]|nr:PKD domain-containing protein [Anaerolineae bacterium]